MLQLSKEYKDKVIQALAEIRANFDGTDSAFAKRWGISGSVYNRIKNGYIDGQLRDAQWLYIGRELGVTLHERKWNMARTEVFNIIEEDVMFCKEYAKGRVCVDDCGIGKTYTAKYLSRNVKNCFYIDASQAKTKSLFVKLIARTIGLEDRGRTSELKANIKYYLRMLPQPVVIIDEAGDLEYEAFLELKELWNATEGACGWYMMGAEGLRAKIQRGIEHKRVGFAEIFSRYSERYTTIVPTDRQERYQFYRKLISDVLSVNMTNRSDLNNIVRRCLTTDGSTVGGLRRAESLLILNTHEQ